MVIYDYMIADVGNSKEFYPVVTELLIRNFFIVNILNKGECQQIFINNSSDTEFDKLTRFYRKCTTEPYILLLFDTALLSSNPFRCQEYLLE